MAQKHLQDPILTHNKLNIPLDIDIYDIDAGYEQQLPVFLALDPLLAAPGHIRSFWARVIEHPEEVLLVTGTYKPSFYPPPRFDFPTKAHYNAPQHGTHKVHSPISSPRQATTLTSLASQLAASRQRRHTSISASSRLRPCWMILTHPSRRSYSLRQSRRSRRRRSWVFEVSFIAILLGSMKCISVPILVGQ